MGVHKITLLQSALTVDLTIASFYPIDFTFLEKEVDTYEF